MSKEAVAAFLREVAKDPDLQTELVALAGRHGYEFTTDELSEEDLSAVAGGLLDPGQLDFKKKPAKK